MLFINVEENFSYEILDAISRFADGNIYVAFTVLITLLSAGLLYVAIKKEKIDRKFFPLIWFFLITNFIFSATISMVTLPLKKEAETVNEEYDNLRATINKLEEIAIVDHENVNYLLQENKKLREALLKIKKKQSQLKTKSKLKNNKVSANISIPDEPKLMKTEKSLEEIKADISKIDSAHYKGNRSIKKRADKLNN